MMKSQKTILAWSVTVVVIGLIVVLGVIGSRSSQTSGQIPAISSSDHVVGPTNAKAVLVEYSDFQCPACGAVEPIVKQLKNKYGDKLAVVYREFPLRQTHRYAQPAAQAAEAADLQGKFWEYHEILFDRQSSWSQSINAKQAFVGYAKEIGLDTTKFTADFDSQAVKDRIDLDVASGTAANIPGTPTFFLNGQRISPSSLEDFQKAIDPLLTS